MRKLTALAGPILIIVLSGSIGFVLGVAVSTPY
jgi:hypothetical protein